MSLLLITLPPGPPGHYPWATSPDGQTLAAHGVADAALLPAIDRGMELVAVVPASQISWQRVTLPRGIGPGAPRLRATLIGLLEDQLLDEPEQLHFALAPDAASGASVWVAVCRRDWLQAHLQALDAAARPVARIVPEHHPHDGPLHMTVTGQPQAPLLLASGQGIPGGALALPLSRPALELLPAPAPHPRDADEPRPAIQAEPAVAQEAEQLLATHLRGQPIHIVPAPQRLLSASRSLWDLAQMDLARSGSALAVRRASAFWRNLIHAPLWQPLRWGVLALLLVQIIGLNLLAWHTRADLAQRRQHITQTLTDTFPHVRVVVDAPVQMAREVSALRQATGAPSPRDMDSLLAALAQALPALPPVSELQYTPGELRATLSPPAALPPADALEQARQRLRAQGLHLDTEDASLLLRATAATP